MNKNATPLQKITRLLTSTSLQMLSFAPNARLKRWAYQTALGVCDFKTINRLVEQKGLNLNDDDKFRTILLLIAAHRWISNDKMRLAYACSHATWWLVDPTHRPKLSAEFLNQLLDKALQNPPQSDEVQKKILKKIGFIKSPKSFFDLSANDIVLKKMKFTKKILPFTVIETLKSYASTYAYSSTSVHLCERSTCDELLRRHFKEINWMTDLNPQSDASHHPTSAWKAIVSNVPEPYLLSLLRNYKEVVKDPDFVNVLIARDFSFTVWDSACNKGLDVEHIRETIARHSAAKKETVEKLLEFCDYRSAKQQRDVLIKNVDKVLSEPEIETPETHQPRKRKM